MMKVSRILPAIALATVLLVLPISIYAQTPPADATSQDELNNLPNDIKDQQTQQDQAAQQSDTANTTQSLTSSQEFIVGTGVGVVFGIIAGGAIVWFTKK